MPEIWTLYRRPCRTAKQIARNKDIVIKKADKGGALVVMTREVYIYKVKEYIIKANYVNLSKDSTKIYIQKLNNVAKPILERSTTPDHLKTHALLNNDKVPVIYGMPKIHKKDIPIIRPIVSSIEAPFDGIAWILDRILQPLLHLIPTIVLSTIAFIHRLKDLSINWNCKDFHFILPGIDSQYTSVPVDQVIVSILDLLSEYKLDTFGSNYEDVNTLLQISLHDSYFKFNNTFYMQGNCFAMGNR